ncbi:MAG: tetratricopeptide repeat protein [Chitinispirillales bacterium]|jgi:tetratricopeptide (TPR) repeat protein|nr:tetratricopeptide repeat protein [Chitinispirillales bacterium]
MTNVMRQTPSGGKRLAWSGALICLLCLLSAAVSPLSANPIHYRIAVQYKDEGKFDLAIEEFRKVLAASPDHYDSYMRLAEIYRAQGNHKLVIFNLQRALLYNPGWRQAQLMLADAFAADGQFDRAVREYQVYQNGSDPRVRDSVQTLINRLMDRMRGTLPPATAPDVQKSAAQQPAAQGSAQQQPAAAAAARPAEEAMRNVVSLYEQNKYDEVITAVRAILANHPNHPGAYYYAGLVRMKNKQMDMAKINFRRAIPHPVYGGAANFHLGVILGEEGARNDAVRHLRAALATNATNFDRDEAARLIELYGGQRAPAQPQTAAQTQPQQAAPAQQTPAATPAAATADAAELRAAAPERYTPIEIRIDEMLSMMTVDTITDLGQKLLGGIRAFQAGRFDDALREFRRVLAENPNGPVAAQAIYNAGICLYRLRLYKDAENQFQQFLNRFPNHRFAPRAEFFKASCYQERGDYAVSERLFRQFIQSHRNHEWVGRAYERLGDSYTDLGDHRRALDAYNQALQSRNATPVDRVILNYKLGNAAAALGDNNRAVNFFNAAIETGERNNVSVRVPDSYYKIADIRFRQRNFQAALDFYQRATRKYPDFRETPWGLFQIAGTHRNLRQYREAVDMYRELMQRFPDDYWAIQAQWRLEDTIWEHEFRAGR